MHIFLRKYRRIFAKNDKILGFDKRLFGKRQTRIDKLLPERYAETITITVEIRFYNDEGETACRKQRLKRTEKKEKTCF